MRYSAILKDFYKLGLNQHDADLIDLHFSAASSHLTNSELAQGIRDKLFHLMRYRSHVKAFQTLIVECCDFAHAADPCGEGYEFREAWAFEQGLPDAQMFDSMPSDPNHRVGKAHPSDAYLSFLEDELKGAA